MDSRVIGGEIVIAENARLQIRIYELQQRNRALNADKNELIQENTRLRNRNEEFENENVQIQRENENLKQLNDALKIVLRNAEDERDHYRAANIKEFDDFISNYIFSLFNNIWMWLRIDNRYMTNIMNFFRIYNFFQIPIVFHYIKIIYRKFLRPFFIVPYVNLTEMKRIRVVEILFVNIITIYFGIYLLFFVFAKFEKDVIIYFI